MAKSFEKLLTDFLTGKNSKKPITVGIWFGVVALAISSKEKGSNNFQLLRKVFSPFKSKELKALKNTLMSFLSVDDRFDSMPPEKILAHGEKPELGDKELCEFGKNFATQEDLESFYGIARSGLLSENIITAKLNIVSKMMWEEAAHAKEFLESKSLSSREALKNSHIEIGKFMLHTFSTILSKGKYIENTAALNYEKLEEIYPTSSELAHLAQMYDDCFDIFRDLHDEIENGRPSGNVVLEKLHRREELINDDGTYNKNITKFYESRLGNYNLIKAHKIPPELKNALQETKEEFFDMLEKANIKSYYKTVLRSSFKSTMREGFKATERGVSDKVLYEQQIAR